MTSFNRKRHKKKTNYTMKYVGTSIVTVVNGLTAAVIAMKLMISSNKLLA